MLEKYTTLKTSLLERDPDQPRQEFDEKDMADLKLSIKEKGILVPIVVEKNRNKYLIVDGERRYRTAISLKLKEVPVKIIPASANKFERNILRFHYQEKQKQWNAFEKAKALKEIKDSMQLTNDELAKMIGWSSTNLSRYLDIFNLSQKDQKIINEEKMPISFASTLSMIQRNMPVELAKKYPNFTSIIIDKYRKGHIGTYKEIQKLHKLVQERELKMLDKFFSDKTCRINDVTKEISYEHKNMIRKANNYAVKLINSYTNIKNENIKLNDDDYAISRKLNKLIETL